MTADQHPTTKPLADLTASDRRYLRREQLALDQRAANVARVNERAARRAERAIPHLSATLEILEAAQKRGTADWGDVEAVARALSAAKIVVENLRAPVAHQVVRFDIAAIMGSAS